MIRKNSEYPLKPPHERGTGRAFALALVMHALLGLLLYHGIQWQNSTPAGEEAELWTEVPDSAIPHPVAPPPPVPVAPAPPVRDEQADIALQPNDILYVPFSWMRNVAMSSSSIGASTAGAAIYAIP